MIIREARMDDYEGLIELYAELDEFHRLNHPELFIQPEKAYRTVEYIDDLISSNDKMLLIAEEGSKIIGLAECFIASSAIFPVIKKRKWVQVDSIAVKKDYQHQNVGSLLLNEVIQWAKSKKINRIELKTYAFNVNAIEFYSKNGFVDLAKIMYLNLEN